MNLLSQAEPFPTQDPDMQHHDKNRAKEKAIRRFCLINILDLHVAVAVKTYSYIFILLFSDSEMSTYAQNLPHDPF